jgi:hypothetical protein
MARRLQSEEQAQLYQRMLEMAGYGEAPRRGLTAQQASSGGVPARLPTLP